MRGYSINFRGMNDEKNCFYYSLNSKVNKKIILRVYNSYLNYLEYEEAMDLSPDVEFWTYVPSNNKNRYVEFRDAENLEIVGMFGLEGLIDIEDYDNFGYVKKIFGGLKPGEKHNVYVVFNELTTQKTYNNDFVCVEEGDLVVDIGFNYGLFSLTSLKYNPSKIIAFEPNPNLAETFLNFFGSDIVDLNQKAVSDRNGYTTFYENLDPGMSTILGDINLENIGNSYNVEIVNFSDFITDNQIERIDYLKVDCEGAEYSIFGSISDEYLKNNISKVAIEFHHRIDDERVQNLINRLKFSNFEVKIVYEENSSIGLLYGKK
jgi:FkbM family methyltransferase